MASEGLRRVFKSILFLVMRLCHLIAQKRRKPAIDDLAKELACYLLAFPVQS
jgi:hypothetical protein